MVGPCLSILYTVVCLCSHQAPDLSLSPIVPCFPGGSEGKASAYKRETWVRSLSWEDPLEKEMATHSSTLAWKIPWMEELGRLQFMGSQRVGDD